MADIRRAITEKSYYLHFNIPFGSDIYEWGKRISDKNTPVGCRATEEQVGIDGSTLGCLVDCIKTTDSWIPAHANI